MKRAAAALLGAAISALMLAPPEVGAAAPIKSNHKVPLDLVVEGTTEPILLSGSVHIVTELRANSLLEDEVVTLTSLQVHTNLVDVTGTGVTTGTTSRIRGSQSFSFLIDADPGNINTLEVLLMILKKSLQEDQEIKKHLLEQMLLRARLEFDDAGLLVLVTFQDFHGPCD